MLYFKFAHGVKSGGFNTAATLPVALVSVKPERLNSFEGGYKSQWFGGKLTFDVTAFHYDYRNIQVNVVGPNPGAVGGATVSYLQNAAKGHANGAEFELAGTPTERLKLNASVGLLYTKFDSFQVVNGGANYSGNQFVRSPHLTLNVGGTYTIPLVTAGKIELEADARYTSLQYFYVNVQDTTNRYLLDQPAYTLANARITWTAPNDRLSASFYVDNFLNTVYRNHALPAYSPTTGVYGDIVQYGDRRTVGGSLIYRF
jgi:iron complex outermembrane receptor protein